MSQTLPTGRHRFMTQDEIDFMKLSDESTKVYTREVDLDHPDRIHDLHNYYLLTPENITIDKVRKLIPNLNNKHKVCTKVGL